MDWFLLVIIGVGLVVWLVTRRLLYMLVYYSLFSLGLFFYRLFHNYTLTEAFFSSVGLVNIIVIVIAIVLVVAKVKGRLSDNR